MRSLRNPRGPAATSRASASQLSTAADRIFGLLTHPTIPPLAASLAIGERLGVSGRTMLEAFLVGFEVECKIADAIYPTHYKQGFHTSGTIGAFGAMAASAKLLKLDRAALAHAIGITASMSAGIRVSFGTMTEGPRLNADLMFEDVFKEMPQNLQRQQALMRKERNS